MSTLHVQCVARGARVPRRDLALLQANARAAAARSALRDEWEQMLRLNASLRDDGNAYPEKFRYLDASDAHLRTLLAALDMPKPEKPGFKMKLCSVGNPDFREFYGEGALSPTFTVEAPTLVLLVQIQQAYTAVYELGGGNCPSYLVYLREVLVARISYNGRVWTPEEYPRCREIDPVTGGIKPSAKGSL